MLPQHEVIAYSLHVKGFTRQSASGVRHKGTFAGLVEKIPYLAGLGRSIRFTVCRCMNLITVVRMV